MNCSSSANNGWRISGSLVLDWAAGIRFWLNLPGWAGLGLTGHGRRGDRETERLGDGETGRRGEWAKARGQKSKVASQLGMSDVGLGMSGARAGRPKRRNVETDAWRGD